MKGVLIDTAVKILLRCPTLRILNLAYSVIDDLKVEYMTEKKQRRKQHQHQRKAKGDGGGNENNKAAAPHASMLQRLDLQEEYVGRALMGRIVTLCTQLKELHIDVYGETASLLATATFLSNLEK